MYDVILALLWVAAWLPACSSLSLQITHRLCLRQPGDIGRCGCATCVFIVRLRHCSAKQHLLCVTCSCLVLLVLLQVPRKTRLLVGLVQLQRTLLERRERLRWLRVGGPDCRASGREVRAAAQCRAASVCSPLLQSLVFRGRHADLDLPHSAGAQTLLCS